MKDLPPVCVELIVEKSSKEILDRKALAPDSVDEVKSKEEAVNVDTSANVISVGTKFYEESISTKDKLTPCFDSAAVDAAHNFVEIRTAKEVKEVGRKSVTGGKGTPPR